jgi:NTE family protein
MIAAKTGNAAIRFAGLKEKGYKDLYVTGTDLTEQKMILFSHETFPRHHIFFKTGCTLNFTRLWLFDMEL